MCNVRRLIVVLIVVVAVDVDVVVVVVVNVDVLERVPITNTIEFKTPYANIQLQVGNSI